MLSEVSSLKKKKFKTINQIKHKILLILKLYTVEKIIMSTHIAGIHNLVETSCPDPP